MILSPSNRGDGAGVPAVVMPDGGPRYLIDHGKNGFIANCDNDFVRTVLTLAESPDQLLGLKIAARAAACQRWWHDVFERLYESYRFATTVSKKVRA